MKSLTVVLALTIALVAAVCIPGEAQADFGLKSFDVTFTDSQGATRNVAGSHPYAVNLFIQVNGEEVQGKELPDGAVKDLEIAQAPGLVGDLTAVPTCSTLEFLTIVHENATDCGNSTAIGIAHIELRAKSGLQLHMVAPIYNLAPIPGWAARLGFSISGVPVTSLVSTNPNPPYNIVASTPNISQALEFTAAQITLWGVPADSSHDEERGTCYTGGTGCPVGTNPRAFVTLPRACTGPLATEYSADPWQNPGAWIRGGAITHDGASPPNPEGMLGCGGLGFAPRISAEATTQSAETGSGFNFDLDFTDEGLKNPEGFAASETKKAVVTLPRGVTINPSVGEGLEVCTPAQLKRETIDSAPGEGCPEASKVGALTAEFPIIDEPVKGSIFLAQEDDPTTTEHGAENPFDSLLAAYFVVKNQNLGAIAKLPVLIEPDPNTGQLVVTLDNVPQFPLSHFNAHLREGARAALVSPAACGTYATEAKLYPWSDPANPRTVTSSFEITKGKGGGPCPPEGIPPFHPHFEAGSVNNNAGSFSSFNMRLIREDGEQDMTKFSATLPPGELGSLAGVSKCPDSAIAIAKAKTGRQEITSPSCPANSLIGHTLAGAGVGSSLTYVKGYAYLGGPYHGDPLSVIAITPAVAGPFDAGTVVVQEALTLNPKTAEVEVDGANSDPIPHIIKGIVLKLRDLRVYVDRPNFTLNPTSCDESSARSVLFGSNLNVLDPSDDRPIDLSTRYQAANCQNLGFKPKLALILKGGTKRGGHPGLRALYTPRKGDANVKGLVVRLPRSAFLDQAHIKTICTRVQFAAGGGNGEQCPAASRYGFIKAYTPLLDEPLEGPVFLRSSNHKLPDLVFALHGLVNIEVDVRIDSKNGGIRATVEEAPDAPLSKVDLRMQGAKKGLIINSRNLCGAPSHADVTFTGHNGKQFSSKPLMKPECGGKRKR